MRHHHHHHDELHFQHWQRWLLMISTLVILFISSSITTTHSKSIIEPCITTHSCPSLLSYLLPHDSKLSEIATRFQVNIFDILGANNINPTTPPLPSIENQIIRAGSLIKVPISCACVDGIRRSISTTYVVRPADTVDSISEGYGGLVSGDQIRSVNGVSEKKGLVSGERVVVPLPCTCFDNNNNGVASLFMAYVVQSGETLGGIAMEFGTTVSDLETVNGLALPLVAPADILAVPIPACSSGHLNWYNEGLIVANASYSLTATNCIKCICGPTDLKLRCFPSRMDASCSNLQCKGSDLFIGDSYVNRTAIGCNITTCVYRGHNGGKIFSSLLNSTHVKCPAGSGSNCSDSPMAFPWSSSSSAHPAIPFVTLSPSPSPSMRTKPNISSHIARLLTPSLSYIFLLPFGFSFCFIIF